MNSNDALYIASGVVPVAHLNATIRLLSGVIGYPYSDWDKDAIWYGALETDDETGPAFEYRVGGEAILDLTFRRQEIARAISITASGDNEDLLARCQTVINVLRDFDASKPFAGLQSVIAETFATNVYPGDDNLLSCSAAHFEQCDECQETFANFASRKWESVFKGAWQPAVNYADLTFLSRDAVFYFFPSYLAASLSPMASGLLDCALNYYYPDYGFRIGEKTPLLEYGFSAAQAQLVEVVKETTSMETHVFLGKDCVQYSPRGYRTCDDGSYVTHPKPPPPPLRQSVISKPVYRMRKNAHQIWRLYGDYMQLNRRIGFFTIGALRAILLRAKQKALRRTLK